MSILSLLKRALLSAALAATVAGCGGLPTQLDDKQAASVAPDSVEAQQDDNDVAVASSALYQGTGTMGVSLNSFDSGMFPMLYMSVAATEDGVPIGALTRDDFWVEEDGRLQTDLFEVTPPQQQGGTRLADIVFLIDASGSMGGEIAAVRNNCIAFANGLEASGVDYRLGLVEFGYYTGANPRILGGLTDDAEEFKTWVSGMRASGGYEPGLQAIQLAINTFNFRPGAQKVFVLITDEDSDAGDLGQTINLALANDVTVHACVDCSFGASQSHYCNATSIRGATGGLLFNVVGPYDAILDTIVGQISNTYLVRYRTDNPACDGVVRNVQIFVSNGTSTASVATTYTPCGAPVVERTPETVALHSQALIANASVTISATVTDLVEPFVQGATLYARTTGAAGYTQIPMTSVGGDVYSATIPAALVQSPGVDYYIHATDGQVGSTDPGTEPSLYPYQLAVMPNEAPAITHSPPGTLECGTDIAVPIHVDDTTHGISDVSLYYRQAGEILWNAVTAGTYPSPHPTSVDVTATIPAGDTSTSALEYYIEAVDDFNVGSVWPVGGADAPYVLSDATAPTVQCNAHDFTAAPVAFAATAQDQCQTVEPTIVGYECWMVAPGGRIRDVTSRCVVDTSGGTLTVTNPYAPVGWIEWTVEASDDSGNTTIENCRADFDRR